MARTAAPVLQLARNAGTITTLGTIDTTNDQYIPATVTGDFVLYVNNTGTVAGTAHILPGDNPPGLTQATGTLDIVWSGAGAQYIELETARFTQSDGTIHINWDDTLAGSVLAIETRVAGVS